MKIGKANFGGNFVKREYWKLKDGEQVYRILPPLGDLADSGKWSFFYNVHYGYKNSAGKMRVFQSPLVKNRSTKMIESPDAALERIEKIQAQQKAAKAAGDKETDKKLTDLLQIYNLDNNHYVNALDKNGNIGILKLRHRAKLALDATIKRLRDQGTEPLDADSGRYFVFRRSGNGLDTSFQVDILRENINVEGIGMVQKEVVHTIDDALIQRLSKEAAQLDKLYQKPTSEQVARIVKEGAKAVDEILDTKATNAAAAVEYVEEELGQAPAAPAPQAAAPSPAPQQTFASPPEQKAAAPTAAAPSVADKTDDEFLKEMGL